MAVVGIALYLALLFSYGSGASLEEKECLTHISEVASQADFDMKKVSWYSLVCKCECMTCMQVLNEIQRYRYTIQPLRNKTCTTSGAETTYNSGATHVSTCLCCSIVYCLYSRSLFVLSSFFLWSLHCLHFLDLRRRVTSLISWIVLFIKRSIYSVDAAQLQHRGCFIFFFGGGLFALSYYDREM